MSFTFDEDIAKNYGVHSAIFIEKLSVYRGYIFSHSVQELSVLFPFFSTRQIKNVMKKLRDQGIVSPVFDQFNGLKKTQSYRFSEEFLANDKHMSSINKVPFRPFLSHLSKKVDYNVEFTDFYKYKFSTVQALFVPSFVDTIVRRKDFIQCRLIVRQNQWSYCAVQVKYPTVMKLYMNKDNKYNYNNKEKRKEKKKKEKNSQEKNVDNFSRKCPASPEHFMLSKLVLAELNNLLLQHKIRRSAFPPSPLNLGPIIAQLKAGYSLDDCLHVVKIKFQQWYDVPKMHVALNTKTLFSEKFENYVGENFKEIGNGNKKNSGSSGGQSTAASRCNETLDVFTDALNRARAKYGSGS